MSRKPDDSDLSDLRNALAALAAEVAGLKGARAELDAVKAQVATLVAANARAAGERLLEACRAREAAIALRLIGEGAALDFADGNGSTPLMFAVQNGLDGVALRLVQEGAKLNVVNAHRKTALDYAAQAAMIAAIKAAGGLPAAEVGLSPAQRLYEACKGKRAADAMLLIDEGAALDFVDRQEGPNKGDTPLIWASCYEQLDAVAEALVGKGADFDVTNASGGSALIFACMNGRVKTAQLLVSKGAELDFVRKVNGHLEAALDHCAGKAALLDLAVLLRSKGGHLASELTPDLVRDRNQRLAQRRSNRLANDDTRARMNQDSSVPIFSFGAPPASKSKLAPFSASAPAPEVFAPARPIVFHKEPEGTIMHISAAAGLENDSAEEHRLRTMPSFFLFTAPAPSTAPDTAFPKFVVQPPSVCVPSAPAPAFKFSFGSAAVPATPPAQSFAAIVAPPPPTFSFKFGAAVADQPAPAFLPTKMQVREFKLNSCTAGIGNLSGSTNSDLASSSTLLASGGATRPAFSLIVSTNSASAPSFPLQSPPCVVVRLSSGSLGAKLSGGTDGCGAVVSSVVEGGAAAVAGVQKGFRLREVNSVDVLSQPLLSVLSSIKAALAATSDLSPAEFRFSRPSDDVHESTCPQK